MGHWVHLAWQRGVTAQRSEEAGVTPRLFRIRRRMKTHGRRPPCIPSGARTLAPWAACGSRAVCLCSRKGSHLWGGRRPSARRGLRASSREAKGLCLYREHGAPRRAEEKIPGAAKERNLHSTHTPLGSYPSEGPPSPGHPTTSGCITPSQSSQAHVACECPQEAPLGAEQTVASQPRDRGRLSDNFICTLRTAEAPVRAASLFSQRQFRDLRSWVCLFMII